MITLGWFLVILRYYNEISKQLLCTWRTWTFSNALEFYTEQSFLVSFIKNSQNIVRKMPKMGLKIGVAMSVWLTLERLNKTYVLFLYFYHFIIFIHFLCTDRYMHKIISLIFNCIRHVCFTDTTVLSSNCGRRIWQPDVLPTLLNARNDES